MREAVIRREPDSLDDAEQSAGIAEAAERLEIGVEAARKRIRRGTLRASRRDGTALRAVVPSDDADVPVTPSGVVGAAPDDSAPAPAAERLTFRPGHSERTTVELSRLASTLAAQISERDRRIAELEAQRDGLLTERERWHAEKVELAHRLGRVEGQLAAEREQAAAQFAEERRRVQELEFERASLYSERGRLQAELEHARAELQRLHSAAEEAATRRQRWWSLFGR